MRRKIGERVLFKTQAHARGSDVLLGLGQQGLQSGDKVWLLRGGSVLYVLRPRISEVLHASQVFDCVRSSDMTSASEERESTYQLIGDAFVHGLMDAQLLGMMGEHQRRARLSALESIDRRFRDILLV